MGTVHIDGQNGKKSIDGSLFRGARKRVALPQSVQPAWYKSAASGANLEMQKRTAKSTSFHFGLPYICTYFDNCLSSTQWILYEKKVEL
jgi:hypothetical protein